jgi:hypothetical protein
MANDVTIHQINHVFSNILRMISNSLDMARG